MGGVAFRDAIKESAKQAQIQDEELGDPWKKLGHEVVKAFPRTPSANLWPEECVQRKTGMDEKLLDKEVWQSKVGGDKFQEVNFGLKAQEKVSPREDSNRPYGYDVEELFQHSTYPSAQDRWLWIPKGRVLRPELGFRASRREIERFGGRAIRIKRILPPKPLDRSYLEVVMDRDPWRGNPRGQKRPAEGQYDRFGKPIQMRGDERRAEDGLREQLVRQNEERRRAEEEERRRREEEDRRRRSAAAEEARRREQGRP